MYMWSFTTKIMSYSCNLIFNIFFLLFKRYKIVSIDIIKILRTSIYQEFLNYIWHYLTFVHFICYLVVVVNNIVIFLFGSSWIIQDYVKF